MMSKGTQANIDPHFVGEDVDKGGSLPVMNYRQENNVHRNLATLDSLADHELRREFLLSKTSLRFLILQQHIRLRFVHLEATTRMLREVVIEKQQRKGGFLSAKEIHPFLHAIEETNNKLKRRLVQVEARARRVRKRQAAFVYRRLPKQEEALPEVNQSHVAPCPVRSIPPWQPLSHVVSCSSAPPESVGSSGCQWVGTDAEAEPDQTK